MRTAISLLCLAFMFTACTGRQAADAGGNTTTSTTAPSGADAALDAFEKSLADLETETRKMMTSTDENLTPENFDDGLEAADARCNELSTKLLQMTLTPEQSQRFSRLTSRKLEIVGMRSGAALTPTE